MNLTAAPATGPFRGALAFDESGASMFFGRQPELEALAEHIVVGGQRVVVITGEVGVGRTSLLRAGILPLLANNGVLGLYVGDYGDLEHELVQGASRARAEPPAPGEGAAAYTARLAHENPGGVVLVLDHLEELLGDGASPEALLCTTNFLRDVLSSAGQNLRLIFSIEASFFPRLGRFLPRSVLSATGATFEVTRLNEDRAAAIIEQTVLQTGTFIEAGLANLMAADLCRAGPCLPLDLQLLARTVMELRLTSVRRYERSGGASVLLHTAFDRVIREAGGRAGFKVLLDLRDGAGRSVDELAERTRLPKSVVEQAVATFFSRGLVGRRQAARGEHYLLVHPGLQSRVAEFGALEIARARRARQLLSRRLLSRGRLSLPELMAVSRHLGGTLDPAEQQMVRRSVRRKLFHVSVGGLIVLAFLVVLFMDLRASYTLGFEPTGDRGRARVVVRMGKPSRPLLSLLPHRPPFGSVLADTGFLATGLAPDLAQRIERGQASGKLERTRGAPQTIPGWLRTTLAGLSPVVRGTAAVLLGDPAGVVALKQAFSDESARRETLEVLRVVGQGGAGEDEILAASLADPSPELRRRAVEVAAAIDRRMGNGVHAGTLRAALSDASPMVREAAVVECASLPADEAGEVLRVAVRSADPELRKQAELAIVALGRRAPAQAARAALPGAVDADSMLRKSSLQLFEVLSRQAPDAVAPILAELVADAATPEDSRIGALRLLRNSGTELATLAELIARAASSEAPPRLRAAALPLHARLIEPAQAEELALAEARGQVLSRAAAAAIWGILSESHPEGAAKALKVALFDGAPEVRAEAARSAGNLRRDGLTLAQRALLDPNPEVARAALEAVVQLARFNAYAATEALGKALRLIRPTLRPAIVEALGEIGRDKPQVVLPPIVRAFKEGSPSARAQVAQTLCTLATRDPGGVSPFLRLAARDPDREVRAAVAICLVSLAEGDPKGAVRIGEELSQAAEAEVRVAVAGALPALVERAGEGALGLVLTLLGDADERARALAAGALGKYGEAKLPLGRRTQDAQSLLTGILAQGGRAERLLVVETAARVQLAAVLRQAARERDDVVRIEALRGAARMQPPEIELLQAALHADAPAVRAEAMKLFVAASESGAANVLPVFENMLRSSDPEERSNAARSLGTLAGADEGATRLLAELLGQRSEALRRTAAEALGSIAARNPALARPVLERALDDAAHDVRVAAGRGLAVAWAGERPSEAIAAILAESESDSRRRFVALEALLHQAADPEKRPGVAQALARIGDGGPALARLAARLGLAFLDAKPGEASAFIERLLGG